MSAKKEKAMLNNFLQWFCTQAGAWRVLQRECPALEVVTECVLNRHP